MVQVGGVPFVFKAARGLRQRSCTQRTLYNISSLTVPFAEPWLSLSTTIGGSGQRCAIFSAQYSLAARYSNNSDPAHRFLPPFTRC